MEQKFTSLIVKRSKSTEKLSDILVLNFLFCKYMCKEHGQLKVIFDVQPTSVLIRRMTVGTRELYIDLFLKR